MNLYVQSVATAQWGDDKLTIAQQTQYPWSGDISLRVTAGTKSEQGLFLRIPGWAGTAKFKLNGKVLQPGIDKGYAVVRRRWTTGDVVEVSLPMEVQRLQANPAVVEDRGRVALRRGPIVYCLEQVDHKVDIDRIYLPSVAKLEFKSGAITGEAMMKPVVTWDDTLYRVADSKLEGPVALRAVPYAGWGNRGTGKMAVWIEGSVH